MPCAAFDLFIERHSKVDAGGDVFEVVTTKNLLIDLSRTGKEGFCSRIVVL